MGNDLISRKALMQEIEKSMNNNPHIEPKVKVNHEQEHKHFMRLLSKQPTAYDVEWVVKKLQKCSEEYQNSFDEYERGKAFAYSNAISFVKTGGIDGNERTNA